MTDWSEMRERGREKQSEALAWLSRDVWRIMWGNTVRERTSRARTRWTKSNCARWMNRVLSDYQHWKMKERLKTSSLETSDLLSNMLGLKTQQPYTARAFMNQHLKVQKNAVKITYDVKYRVACPCRALASFEMLLHAFVVLFNFLIVLNVYI